MSDMADGILSLLRNTASIAIDSDEEIMKEVVYILFSVTRLLMEIQIHYRYTSLQTIVKSKVVKSFPCHKSH